MVETSLILDALILTLIIGALLRSFLGTERVHDRLDDVIDGVDLFANEVLNRTQFLMEKAQAISPAIELHNHNPLEQVFKFIQGMKTGNFSDENITSHRDSAGQYAATPQEIENAETQEIIDITD
jgi:hypothetical protein